jgi:uncharacterized membrane protein YeaQ/YmgE (transglycosylase-associated protein family)
MSGMGVGLSNLVTWLIVGLAGGSLAAVAITRRRWGFGLWRNLALGAAGALVGGGAFAFFDIWPWLAQVTFSLRDVLAAFLGSIVVFLALWLWRWWNGTPKAQGPVE